MIAAFLSPECRRWSLVTAALALTGCGSDKDSLTDGTEPVPEPFRAAATCGECHPQHFEEWKSSMHAFAGSDPLMRVMAEMASNELGNNHGEKTCVACHAPSLVRQQKWLTTQVPRTPGELEDVTEDGISCDVCHSISIVPPVGSIDFLDEVDPTGPKLGGIRDPQENPFHESRHDNSFTTSIQCAPCHQISTNGFDIENTFLEWERSNLSGQGIECQTCHMPNYTGQAATAGPVRTDVHHHTFTGVDYAYEPFRGIDLPAQKDRIRELLQNSVSVEVLGLPAQVSAGESVSFSIRVRNDKTGHSIPSGTSFARQMWLSVTVLDSNGDTIYRSGHLEENGDWPSLANDLDFAWFGSQLFDENEEPTPFLWRAFSIDESRLIPYLEESSASYTFDVPAEASGPLTFQLALLFRPVGHKLVRDLGLDRLLPIEIFEMWASTTDVPLQ